MEMNWKFWATLSVASILTVICMFLPEDVLLASLVNSLALPAAIFLAVWIFRDPISKKIYDMREAETPGGFKAKFDSYVTRRDQEDSSTTEVDLESEEPFKTSLRIALDKYCLVSLSVAYHYDGDNKQITIKNHILEFQDSIEELRQLGHPAADLKELEEIYSLFLKEKGITEPSNIS